MTQVMNVAMIGGGFMGKAHAMAYAAMPMFFWPAPAIPHRKVVVDVTDGAAEAARQRFGFDEASSDWRAVVARPDIDVVDICTPNNVHAEIAIAAARAGKHIICEKPLARTVEEARAMAEAVKAADVIRDTILLYGLMLAFAAGGIATWGSLWTVPFWLAYGVLYGSASDSRWHECSHGTAFRTPWMNNAVYQISSFMIMRNPVTWRWSHARHHSETYLVGRDPEIAVMRPTEVAKLILNFFGILDVLKFFPTLVRNALAGPTPEEKTFVPESEWPRVQRVAQIHLAIYLATGAMAIVTGSVLPLMVIGLPRIYGAWHHVMTGLLQHGGLADNVIDHRLNSRTVYMNPVSRFIYWNMNYHVEHHMFPMVPYHALPRLHAAIKDDLPAPNLSIAAGFAEMWPALKRQMRYEDFFLKRDLPPTAKLYREDFHLYVPGMMPPKAAE